MATEPKKIFISQSNYIPWRGYFDLINYADAVVLYDEMQYSHGDWRNRNKIKTPQGTKWLTVPVRKTGRLGQKINETKAASPAWASKHWNSIRHSYAKTNYFSDYHAQFAELYAAAANLELLSDINRLFLDAICGLLGIKTPLHWSREFTLRGGKTEKVINLCRDLGAGIYVSGPSAQDYLEEELFAQAGIELHYADYSGYPVYPQLYGGFEHAVSIIDLLFSTGPDARSYMKTFLPAAGKPMTRPAGERQ